MASSHGKKRVFAEFWGKVKVSFASIDWSKPTYKVDKYAAAAFGVELTLRNVGPGIGFGLGLFDLWIGCPKKIAR